MMIASATSVEKAATWPVIVRTTKGAAAAVVAEPNVTGKTIFQISPSLSHLLANFGMKSYIVH